MDTLWQDLRHAFRVMVKSPTFTIATVLSLTLGIGANTAIFSIMNSLMLSPLPFENEEQVVRLRDVLKRPGREPRMVGMSALNYSIIKEEGQSFSAVAAQDYASFNIAGTEEPTRVQGCYISAGVMPLLGVKPILGRGIRPDEDQPGARTNVVILGEQLWHRHFGGDPEILDETVTLNDEVYTVIGIMGSEYIYPYDSELWVPLALDAVATPPTQHHLNVVARLEPDVSREQAQEELEVIGQRLAQEYPDTNTGWDLLIVSAREDLTDDVQPKLYFALLATTGLLLLIACANVANMLLARALRQQGEIAMRAALGAGRLRLIRQLLTQGLSLALVSGALGLLLAYWAMRPLIALSPIADMNVVFQNVQIDIRVLGYTLLASVLVGVLFSLIPAFKISKPDLQSCLREGSRTTIGGAGRLVLSSLVVVEIALAVVLLVGAGLMVKSFQRLNQVEVGFARENRLVLHISLSPAKYPESAQKTAFVQEVLGQMESVPGVVSAGAVTTHPLDSARVATGYSVEGQPPSSPNEILPANHRLASAGYLRTMGIAFLRGESFTDRDRTDTPGVVVVSKRLADAHWPGEDPIGNRIKPGRYEDPNVPWLTVVGVAADVKDRGSFDRTWYVAMTQEYRYPSENVTLVAETSVEPSSLIDPIRNKIWELDRTQPIWGISTADQLITGSYREQHFGARLSGTFAGLGLILAIIGIYGVLSYTVIQQTHELGLRVVFGAQRVDVLKLVIVRGMTLSAIGLVLGLALAFASTRYLTTLLYEISPTDPATLIGISLGILVIALLASYLPARRATRIDPINAIRYE